MLNLNKKNPLRSDYAQALVNFRKEIKWLMNSKIWNRNEANLICNGIFRGFSTFQTGHYLLPLKYIPAMDKAIPAPEIPTQHQDDDDCLDL